MQRREIYSSKAFPFRKPESDVQQKLFERRFPEWIFLKTPFSCCRVDGVESCCRVDGFEL